MAVGRKALGTSLYNTCLYLEDNDCVEGWRWRRPDASLQRCIGHQRGGRVIRRERRAGEGLALARREPDSATKSVLQRMSLPHAPGEQRAAQILTISIPPRTR